MFWLVLHPECVPWNSRRVPVQSFKCEKYYLQGLAIEPNHNGINEYLGELYIVTNRMDLAKERLNVLKSCNCKEYKQLKEIIDGKKKSKY